MPSPRGERERGVSLPRDWSSIRELRQARGLSQSRLAELSGVSERTVRAIEGGAVGRPQHESLRRLATVLAYGDTHRARLVERWTGGTAHLTPDGLGIPDWEVLYRRMGTRTPADGGQMSTVICELTVGSDRLPRLLRYTHGHEQMSASGSPVVWKLTSGLPFDLSAVRFEVLTGGVLDDFFVHGDMAALAIRPDPLQARNGPFLVEYSVDFSGVEPLADTVEREWMYASTSPLQLGAMVVRFTGDVPERLWSVRGASATTAERQGRIQVAPNGSAQVCFQDLVGVFGIQWEWGDETPAERQ
ncbi:helix-turn-helix domain-containing protein [Phycicoccus sp. Soil802]|uniref:helix-turn-helix domain-containing protein n=1 Tax=Phycicoccus sp. Soil802 TaxID=1736414 RepID=UPI000AD56C5D|nr:helix-turn-helix domain-containing protein [Phycicoccus sp. Soil802]